MLVDTCVGELYVEVVGEGRPLLLWPSLLTDGSMWRLQVPELRAAHRLIVIDPPGHGRSAAVRRPFTLEDCADAAAQVLDHLEIEVTDWAGLSWGGMVGMRFALRHPSRLRRLALLDTSARAELRRKLPSYHVMAFVARRVGAFGLLLDRLEPMFFTADTVAHRRDLVDPFREHLARMDPPSVGYAVDAVIFERRDIRRQLRQIDAPTLVIVGADDRATPPARAREVARGIRGAELLCVPAAAHLSSLEQPAAVNRALLAHFG